MNWRGEIAGLLDALKPRAASLIITVYGDAVVPRGGQVWLGDLIGLLAPLGLGERAVRTAVHRLSREGWFRSEQFGRRSYYGLTEQARHRFEAAARRVYDHSGAAWDGNWTLVLLRGRGLAPEARERFRRELGWLGFGAISPNAHAHPAADRPALVDLVAALELKDRVVVMDGGADHSGAFAPMRSLAGELWPLAEVAATYDAFRARFHGLEAKLAARPPAPEQAFVLRALVLHEFRRAVIKDPMLPAELLPGDWPGVAARALTGRLYAILLVPSEAHLMARMTPREGPPPAPAAAFFDRFGGLPAADFGLLEEV